MGFKYCAEGHLMDPSWKYCPVCLAPLAGWLLALNEDGKANKFFTIHEGKSFIGSGADCEIRILKMGLARQQAYITIIDGLCTIVDLGNGSGLKVNNMETSRTNLIDGDLIEFGSAVFKIKLI
ncbi:MAG: FHA domain-containing protein [Spirochaetales bacterium]|nr:FHA domain-containing protein [Spirochaetales bacterium]